MWRSPDVMRNVGAIAGSEEEGLCSNPRLGREGEESDEDSDIGISSPHAEREVTSQVSAELLK